MPWEQNIHAGNRALASGLFEQAFQRFAQAIEEGRSFGQGDSLWAEAHRGLCRAALCLGRFEQAEKAIEVALATDEAFWGAQSPQLAEDQFLSGEACREQDKFESAKSAYEKALFFWSGQGAEQTEQGLLNLSALLLLYLQSKREQGFEQLHARAFAAYQSTHPTGMWMKFLRLEEALDQYIKQGKTELAAEILNREIAIMSKTLGRNHKELKAILEYQTRVLQESKKYMAAWRIETQIGKAKEEGLFFSQNRSYGLPPEQVVTIITNLLATRGNFMPANTPKILHRSWWQIKKSDPLARRLLALLELPQDKCPARGFAEPPKKGRLELELRCNTDGTATLCVFNWRLHDSTMLSSIRDVMAFALAEFDETFSILPNRMLRHQALETESRADWPSPQMYNEAVQNNRTSFSDKGLQDAAAELNAIGLPRPLSGAFATVYRLRNGQDWAVKCFTEPVLDHQERYRQISKHLKEHKLAFFTEFEYQACGIKVQNKDYPILKMGWVEGQTLNLALAGQLGNRDALLQMAAAFVHLANEMQLHGIAHGDLQHGNILVGAQKFTLVDYDGMFVPALSGLQSNEIGHRNYQHPARNSTHFGLFLDNFSVWVIYSSFFILSRQPELWETLDCGEESLLFKESDFKNPQESKTFYLLANNDDAEVKDAAQTLLQFLSLNLQEIPTLSHYFKQRNLQR